MDDLVEKLRRYGAHAETSAFHVTDEAADRIEALTKALREILEATLVMDHDWECCGKIQNICRAALSLPHGEE